MTPEDHFTPQNTGHTPLQKTAGSKLILQCSKDTTNLLEGHMGGKVEKQS